MISSTWVSPGIEPRPRRPKERARPLDHHPNYPIFQPKVAIMIILNPNFLNTEGELYWVPEINFTENSSWPEALSDRRQLQQISDFSISASPKLTFGLKKTLISVNEVPRILKSAEILKSEICCSFRRSLLKRYRSSWVFNLAVEHWSQNIPPHLRQWCCRHVDQSKNNRAGTLPAVGRTETSARSLDTQRLNLGPMLVVQAQGPSLLAQ